MKYIKIIIIQNNWRTFQIKRTKFQIMEVQSLRTSKWQEKGFEPNSKEQALNP